MKKLVFTTIIASSLLFGSISIGAQEAPFGNEDDIEYAKALWEIMVQKDLAGDNAIRTIPYDGVDPHGKMLETFFTNATLNGHKGLLIIKRNFGPEGVEADAVLANPDKHLGAITVMFQREKGYDEDNQNWFWVKYLPDGSLDKNAKGVALAGKVAKGADKGCIACHADAPGDDFIFTANALSTSPSD